MPAIASASSTLATVATNLAAPAGALASSDPAVAHQPISTKLLLQIVLPLALVVLLALGGALFYCFCQPLYHPNAVVNLRKKATGPAPAYEADSTPPGYAAEAEGVAKDKAPAAPATSEV